MKKSILVACLVSTLLCLAVGPVSAENAGKLGVTARLGFLVPADSDLGISKIETDAGFNYGGGLIYLINQNFAAEIDVTHTEFGSSRTDGRDMGDFEVTNVSLGGQYRFELDNKKFTPYVGAGLDILMSDYDHPNGHLDVDTVLGVHASGGIDYFVTPRFALNAEGKAVIAPEADINNAGGHIGNFDPSSVSGMVGVRFFFN
jgi:outer membrane protein